jgi:hypothetical protein
MIRVLSVCFLFLCLINLVFAYSSVVTPGIKDKPPSQLRYDPDSYEPDDSYFQAGVLLPTTADQSQNHNLHSSTDTDWYSFTGIPGRTFSFYSNGTTDTRVFLYDNTGVNLITSDDDGNGYPNFRLNYLTSTSAVFYLKVDGYNGVLGDYAIHYYFSYPQDSYEPDNNSSSAVSLNPTPTIQNQDHTLHNSSDVDWYTFYGESGKTYEFSSQGTTDTRIYLYDNTATNQLAYDDDGMGYPNFLLHYTPAVSATYYLKVDGYAGAAGAYLFNYLFYYPADMYEPDNSASQSRYIQIHLSETVEAHTLHNTSDEDWLQIYGTPDIFCYFYSSGNLDTHISIYDDNLVLLAEDDDSGDGDNFSLQFNPPAYAYYKVKISGYGYIGLYNSHYYAYVTPDVYEPDNSVTNFTYIDPTPINQTQNHTLHDYTDQDWFRFFAVPGRNYVFSGTSNSDTSGTIYTDDGVTQLAYNDAGGYPLHFEITFNPPAYGYYKLKVNSSLVQFGPYVFSYYYYVNADTYEPDNTASSSNYLSVGFTNQTQEHTLHNTSDQDWYRFLVSPGVNYMFTSSGMTDTYATLYLDDGTTYVTSDDDSGEYYNFQIILNPTEQRYYKLKVTGYNEAMGSYVLNYYYFSEPDAYEPDDIAAQSLQLTVTYSLTSQEHTIHDFSDEDWFRFVGIPGRTYVFTSQGFTDTRISLYLDDGVSLLDSDEDSGNGYNFLLQFTPTQYAYYRFVVKSLVPSFGAYSLYYYYYADPDIWEPDNLHTSATNITPFYQISYQAHTLHSPTDNDFYRFEGIQGRTYVFYSGGYIDTMIMLYQDDGVTLLSQDDDSGSGYGNFYLTFIPPATAYYKLLVRSSSSAVGTYMFNYAYFLSPDAYEPDNGSGQCTAIAITSLQQSQQHNLQTETDQDWFSFTGYAGRTYYIYSSGNTDPIATLYQSDGVSVLLTDDNSGGGGNFFMTFYCTITATYKIKVTGNNGFMGDYTISYFSPMTAPSNLSIARVADTVHLSWTPSPGVTNYIVEASDNPLTGFSLVEFVSGTQWWGNIITARQFFRVKGVE